MICQRCGRDTPPDSGFCQGCGSPVISSPAPPPPPYAGYSAPPGYGTPPPGYPSPPPRPGSGAVAGPADYAGIGTRFLAALVDGLILGIPIGIISASLGAMFAVRVFQRTSSDVPFTPGMAVNTLGTFFAGFGLLMILSILLTWAYFSLMESSAWQGTIGKKIMGIKVTDMNGSRISLGRATIRLAVKAFLSGWFLIGYIMAFFTQRKQALHDLIAGTLVLTRQAAAAPQGFPQQFPPQPFTMTQQPAPQQRVCCCPACGAALQPNARFCSNCGRNV
jgi:uncharacterized RDD family membrane protein YckC